MTIVIYCNGATYTVTAVKPGEACPQCGATADPTGRHIHVIGASCAGKG